MNIVRKSKYRHVYGQPVKKEECFENIRLTKNAFDSNLSSTNGDYIALNWNASGGGAFAVLPTAQFGKLPDRFPLFSGHKGPVLDTDWNPFDDSMVVSASDDATIGVWKVPAGFDVHRSFDSLEDVKDIAPVKFLKGHSKRVGHVKFNPVAENVLASSSVDNTIKIWDVETGEVLYTLRHPQFVTSFSWNFDGTKIVTVAKDKVIRVWDVRNEKVLSEGKSHAGSKGSRVIWLGDHDRVFTTGFSLMSDREMALWDATALEKGPVGGFRRLEPSSGIVIPFYDVGTSIVYLGGRGDGKIVYYEYIDDNLFELFLYQSTTPQRGLAFLSDRKLNVKEHEVARIYKVHESYIEPIPFYVPRKAEGFLEDIYIDVAAGVPAETAKEFGAGKTVRPLVVSWRDIFDGKKGTPRPAPSSRVTPRTSTASNDSKVQAPEKEEKEKALKGELPKESMKEEQSTDSPKKDERKTEEPELKEDKNGKELSKDVESSQENAGKKEPVKDAFTAPQSEKEKAAFSKSDKEKSEEKKVDEINSQLKAEKQDSYDVLHSDNVKSFLASKADDEEEDAEPEQSSDWDEPAAPTPTRPKSDQDSADASSQEKKELSATSLSDSTKDSKASAESTKDSKASAESTKDSKASAESTKDSKASAESTKDSKASADEPAEGTTTKLPGPKSLSVTELGLEHLTLDDAHLNELTDASSKAVHSLHQRVNILTTALHHAFERLEQLESKDK